MAQLQRSVRTRCGTTQYMEKLVQADPALKARLNAYEVNIQSRTAQRKASRALKTTKIVPLVIHVIYNTPEQNISDAQIQSQINVLNQDFLRANPDAINTPASFANAAANTDIQFCLVSIIRKQTDKISFSSNNDVKFCSTGGNDAMDVNKYFNIWVCNLSELLGYGEFPNILPSNTYGAVIGYKAFGTIGTATYPYDKGRTLTHEIAHCLNVHHIFSEDSSVCKTDHCIDIPDQSAPTMGCPQYPASDNCTSDSSGKMFMNYMDYVDDACMNLFTNCQSERMQSVLETFPYSSLTRTGCNSVAPVLCNPNPTNNPIYTPNLLFLRYFSLKNILIFLGVIIVIYMLYRTFIKK